MWIETRRRRIRQRAKYAPRSDPRVIHAEHGWWFPEEGAPEYGVWRSNVNVLTDNAPPYDPQMGTYQLRGVLCRVEKHIRGQLLCSKARIRFVTADGKSTNRK